LIAGALLLVAAGADRDALRDVRRLLVHAHHDLARRAVEPVHALAAVTDVVDDFAGRRFVVDLVLARDLAGDEDEVRRHEAFARDAAVRIAAQVCVEDRIGDLVAHLVGMAFGDGFGCKSEAPAAHSCGEIQGAPGAVK
jgi:hypothetical protein